MKMTGWKLVGYYRGQHPGYAELTDPVHTVDVALYAKGSYRVAVGKGGQVVFRYRINSELLKLPYQDDFII